MTPLEADVLILAPVAVVGALIIYWVRRSRSAIERYRRTTGGPRILRVFVEERLRPLRRGEIVAYGVFAAILLGAVFYFGPVSLLVHAPIDTESRKTVNSFGAELVLTKKPEEFAREWVTTPEPHRLSMQTSQSSKEVHVGEHIAALVLFWGCRSGVDGCRVSVDFELVAPDGSIRYRVPDRLGATLPRPKTELIYMSQAIVRFRFDPNDPLGQYKVNATVREPIAGIVLHVSQQFLVVK